MYKGCITVTRRDIKSSEYIINNTYTHKTLDFFFLIFACKYLDWIHLDQSAGREGATNFSLLLHYRCWENCSASVTDKSWYTRLVRDGWDVCTEIFMCSYIHILTWILLINQPDNISQMYELEIWQTKQNIYNKRSNSADENKNIWKAVTLMYLTTFRKTSATTLMDRQTDSSCL